MVLLVPAPAAAAAHYQTDRSTSPVSASTTASGTVDVLGAVVVSGTDGSGTFVASLVNKDLEEPATLTSVTGEGVEVQVAKQVEVEPDDPGQPRRPRRRQRHRRRGQGRRLRPLTLKFDTGQKTEVNAPIVDRDEESPRCSGHPERLASRSPSGSPALTGCHERRRPAP